MMAHQLAQNTSMHTNPLLYNPPYYEWLVVYNELRFWATATGAASRERREETAREEEGESSGSAACWKCVRRPTDYVS